MSAQKTRLVARPYEPPPSEKPLRSFSEILSAMYAGGLDAFPEIAVGKRGTDISLVRLRGAVHRDLSLSTDPAGGYLRPSEPALTVIEYLGAQLVAGRAGARVVPTVDFGAIPRVTSPPTMYWVGEHSAPPEADPLFGAISPSPKTGAVAVDLTRGLSLFTDRNADAVVTREVFGSMARGVDAAVFHGSGVGEPLGITNVPGIDTRTGASFDLAAAAGMLAAVETGNADPETVSWAIAPDVAELLRQRAKVSGGERMLFEDGKILNRPGYVSSSIASGHLFCGDFSTVIVLTQAVEVLLNVYSQAKQGIREIVGFWFGDVVVTRAGVFSVATAVT